MKKLLILLLFPICAHAQIFPSDTIRTDTLANNLTTYNKVLRKLQMMSGTTLKTYFQAGLLTKTQYATLSARIAADSVLAAAKISTGANIPYSTITGTPTAGTGISISGNVITNTLPDQVVTLTAGNAIAITGTYPNFTIAMVQPAFTFPTRTFNTNYTVSTTKAAYLVYSITTSVTNPLLAGSSSATATLQYSTNGGTTWQTVSSIGQVSAIALAVTIQLQSGQTQLLGGLAPANALVRITYTGTGTNSSSIASSLEYYY